MSNDGRSRARKREATANKHLFPMNRFLCCSWKRGKVSFTSNKYGSVNGYIGLGIFMYKLRLCFVTLIDGGLFCYFKTGKSGNGHRFYANTGEDKFYWTNVKGWWAAKESRAWMSGVFNAAPRFHHGWRKRLPRHDLLGEERWPISQRRRALILFLHGLLLGSFAQECR